MDEKTTSKTFPYNYIDQWTPETQVSMYSWLGNICFPNSVKGMMIDGMCVLVGSTTFTRIQVPRTKSQLDEWYDNSMLHIEHAREATRSREFPMRTTSCHQYGGCAFRKVCSRSPEVRKNFLVGDFVQEGR